MELQLFAELALFDMLLVSCLIAYLRLRGSAKTKREVAKYGGVILMLLLVGGIFAVTPFVSHQSPYGDKPYSSSNPTNHLPDTYSVYNTNFAGQLAYLAQGDLQYCTLNGAGEMWVNFEFSVPKGLASGDTLSVTYYINHRDSIPFLTDWWFRIYVGGQALYEGWSDSMTTLKFNDLASYVQNGRLSVTLHGRNALIYSWVSLGWGLTIDAVVLKK